MLSLAREERGFTLVEMLIALTAMMLILGGGLTLWTATLRNEPRLTARSAQIQAGRVTLERFARELRQGSSALAAGDSQFTLLTYVRQSSCADPVTGSGPAIHCRVTYDCAAGSCSRTVSDPDGSSPGPATTVVSGLADPAVFSYTLAFGVPSYARMTLRFPAASGAESVTLVDGAGLRNLVAAQ